MNLWLKFNVKTARFYATEYMGRPRLYTQVRKQIDIEQHKYCHFISNTGWKLVHIKMRMGLG